MNETKFNQYIKKVDNLLKKKGLYHILTIKLNNFNNTYMYLGVVFHRRSRTFKTFWIDLGKIDNRNLEDWFNINLMYPKEADEMKAIIAQNGMSYDFVDTDNIDSNVIIESYVTNYEYNKKVFTFKRYIPSCWRFLENVVLIIINNMPRNLYYIYQIMIEKNIQPSPNYLFAFDKDKDNIDYLFKDKIVKGNKLYNNDKVINFENIKNTYYGMVLDNKKEYLTTIIYEKEFKEIQFSCTCGSNDFCEHEYACYLNLINNKSIRYKKIAYKDEKIDYFERMKNFQYFLCYKMIDDHFIVVQDKELVAIPILNDKKEFPWEIVEDDDKKSLEKQIKKYLKEN